MFKLIPEKHFSKSYNSAKVSPVSKRSESGGFLFYNKHFSSHSIIKNCHHLCKNRLITSYFYLPKTPVIFLYGQKEFKEHNYFLPNMIFLYALVIFLFT